MNSQPPITTCFAIVSITILATFAIFNGTNGVVLASAIGAIAGLAGYTIKNNRKQK